MSEYWGNPTWVILHTISVKISEETYNNTKGEILNIIKTLFSCLPCMICMRHANNYTKHLSVNTVPTKEHFIKYLFDFHNNVNQKINKPLYDFNKLDEYKNNNIFNAFNTFAHTITSTRGFDFFNDTNKRNAVKLIGDYLKRNLKDFT